MSAHSFIEWMVSPWIGFRQAMRRVMAAVRWSRERDIPEDWVEIACHYCEVAPVIVDGPRIEFYGGPFDGMQRAMTGQEDASIAIAVYAHEIDPEFEFSGKVNRHVTSLAIYSLDDLGGKYLFVTSIQTPDNWGAEGNFRIFAKKVRRDSYID